MTLALTERRTGSTIVVNMQGILDLTTAARLNAALTSLIEAPVDGAGSIVLDFSGVDYVSSAGLRSLIMASKEARKAGKTIVGASLQPNVQKVFEISRFDKVLPCHADVDVALAALGS